MKKKIIFTVTDMNKRQARVIEYDNGALEVQANFLGEGNKKKFHLVCGFASPEEKAEALNNLTIYEDSPKRHIERAKQICVKLFKLSYLVKEAA